MTCLLNPQYNMVERTQVRYTNESSNTRCRNSISNSRRPPPHYITHDDLVPWNAMHFIKVIVVG